MDKPFVFGVAAGPGNFIGRTSERKQLASQFNYGINTILIAPRRTGKTSLVNIVADEETRKGRVIIRLDIFSCRSEYDFLNAFAYAILRGTASHLEELRQNAQDFLSRLSPKINLASDPTGGITLSLGITPKTHRPEEILNLPELIARKKGCDIIVCIDEFQQVGEFPDSMSVQKRMRSAWQHQKRVSYCLYGSKKHIMRSLFQQSSKPFYKFGSVMELGTIPEEEWIPYIIRKFAGEGKTISEELASRICRAVELHPSYVQQLAFNTLVCTKGDNTTEDDLDKGCEALLNENNPLFEEKIGSLTSYQLNLLRAIVSEVHEGFGTADIREEFNLGSPSNIARLKATLTDKELIDTAQGRTFIADPVLKLWLTKRLLQT